MAADADSVLGGAIVRRLSASRNRAAACGGCDSRRVLAASRRIAGSGRVRCSPLAATAISLGTAAGGWRIIKTMGTRVVKLDPVHGFAAETSAATIIFGASTLGMPVSTTHIISSAIMGTGASDRFNAVRWGVARNIGLAWVITLPAAGITAALAYVLLNPILG